MMSDHEDDIDDWKALEHHHFFILVYSFVFVDGCLSWSFCIGPHDEPQKLPGREKKANLLVLRIL